MNRYRPISRFERGRVINIHETVPSRNIPTTSRDTDVVTRARSFINRDSVRWLLRFSAEDVLLAGGHATPRKPENERRTYGSEEDETENKGATRPLKFSFCGLDATNVVACVYTLPGRQHLRAPRSRYSSRFERFKVSVYIYFPFLRENFVFAFARCVYTVRTRRSSTISQYYYTVT